ncbi:aromatic acid exporter family protein [Clostridium taeniosporum]|uniref:Putative aromatic acid exporter C-terminal domain-containing protein n=1 Tax=Clostridium taeniosporum TaxID=394958 RepID=A0A1D7XJZ7_9CLOT|nr:aromatic acid exporter family protein [Clostridium taeniosporum]AOR23439.1 hypothetical protein BGI42_06665 [Clostridium taeniosporum]
MGKYFQSKTVKAALAATIAIFISNYIGIEFAVTSGVIAILSIQNTKREAMIISVRRILASIIAIALSYVLYMLLGNTPVIFGIFLLIFIPITKYAKITEGTIVGAVLSTHLLSSNNINFYWITNEINLTIIGIGVAMAFNLYTVSLEEEFESNKEKIEEYYRIILSDMALSLVTQSVPIYEQQILNDSEKLIKNTKEIAQQINNNYILKNDYYYIRYIDMRMLQLDTIKRMKKHFSKFYMTYEQTKLLSEFTNDIAMNIYEYNDCINLINKLNSLRRDYKSMSLPANRDEFENRALLFQFLNDLEEFLIIKKEFKLSL